jgi:hypothetical protein
MKIKLFDPACRDRTADRTSGNKSEGCRCDRKASHFCIISQSPATLFSDMYFAYHLCPFFYRKVHRNSLKKSENTLREFPLVIATVAKVSRKRGLWLVVRVKKQQHFLTFSPENAAAFYFCK